MGRDIWTGFSCSTIDDAIKAVEDDAPGAAISAMESVRSMNESLREEAKAFAAEADSLEEELSDAWEQIEKLTKERDSLEDEVCQLAQPWHWKIRYWLRARLQHLPGRKEGRPWMCGGPRAGWIHTVRARAIL